MPFVALGVSLLFEDLLTKESCPAPPPGHAPTSIPLTYRSRFKFHLEDHKYVVVHGFRHAPSFGSKPTLYRQEVGCLWNARDSSGLCDLEQPWRQRRQCRPQRQPRVPPLPLPSPTSNPSWCTAHTGTVCTRIREKHAQHAGWNMKHEPCTSNRWHA